MKETGQSVKRDLLSPDEVKRYHAQGYLGPFRAIDEQDATGLRDRIEREVLVSDGPHPTSRYAARHLDHRCVYDLVTQPAILDRMTCIMGPNLLLWAVNFWFKRPGDKQIPWHQDGNYWPIEPVLNLSAWTALDHVDADNSCVHLVPGSHKRVIPHVPVQADKAFAQEADPSQFDSGRAIAMPLKPGEFFLFNERTLHFSDVNRSNRTRYGMSMRVTIPIVRIEPIPPLWEDHVSLLVRGRDTMGFNRLGRPPHI